MNVAGAAFSPPKKRSAKHFSVEDKTGILNIFKAYSEDNPEVSKTDKVEFTAKAAGNFHLRHIHFYLLLCNLGVSIPSVYKILREYTEVHELHSPKKYYRPRAILDNIDSGTKSILRRLLHSFFERNEPPTLSKVLAVLHEDEDLPHLKRTTLWKLIKEIGFRFEKRSRNSVLKEKDEIITWKRRFLREIRKYREEGRKLYFLDETWVNAGHTVSKVWKDTTILTPRQAFINGLSTGLKDASGKGNCSPYRVRGWLRRGRFAVF
ncbi:uncharacterized protein LOC116181943 isoform X1 [Photinus pyralis]|uniref:uncharacterized protein LOC116169628 isoform X1 n=1 Tax=Photinus pyralis TaxID=7054 RepID=UPI001267439A|nr:uncharacterized protein LOC116169628 isoform X1 [Photinus pyralis]XP_031341632.1 uncharacterized protein LOC116169628 isoform X1 [Photinus pyralis]XP_031341730.1 uncharacterized protein LOC116169716 isoform X1 [Photinus pyralis]XP_031341731.1 uncharacterized protein LOC116169716 isoform X1 [Photinus pyralis]XP_031358256.1 uncharacterized protein LOC116181943 isoform X1 [Photinus pyralis]